MVRTNENIGYSMPRQHGLYPPPPILYYDARVVALFIQCAPNIKKHYLPPELKPIENSFDMFLILEYPNTSIGPYNEAVLLLSSTYKEKPGVFVFSIYVNDDVALTAGREIWGIPKKLAEINLSQIKKNKIRGTVVRRGTKLFDINVDILESEPGLNPKKMFEDLPFYNLKLIPDIANNAKPALRQLTETSLKIEKVHKQNAAFPNYLKSYSSQLDISHELIKEAIKDLGGFYAVYDSILPNGKILEDT
ncbi:MAG: acetoacetate decarboxylase family protein [Promethearchaeota archaeon]|jgi:acetoacetate decarboxylase